MKWLRSMLRKRPVVSPTYEDFLGFLRCGFPLSDLGLWFSMSPVHRDLMEHAAMDLSAESAHLIGVASMSPDGAAMVASRYDGGALERKVALTRAASEASRGGPA